MRVFKGKDPTQLDKYATNILLGKTNPLKPPEATLAELNGIEDPEAVVNSAASDVDKCCKKKLHLNS